MELSPPGPLSWTLTGASAVTLHTIRMRIRDRRPVSGRVSTESPLALTLDGNWPTTLVVKIDGAKRRDQLPEGFKWVYEQLGQDMWLFSTSGGTDMCTAFVGGVPTLPVYLGELQARILGASVEAWDDEGRPVPVRDPGTPRSEAFEKVARKLAAQVSIQSNRAIPLMVR